MICYTNHMIITKYTHSCFHIEKDNTAVLIDVGNFTTKHYRLSDIKPFSAILITHQHADHIDPALAHWLDHKNVAIYANQDVAESFPELSITQVDNGVSFRIDGLDITPRNLPHCKMPDGSAGPPNTGYVIDGTFFHPGDGIEIDDLRVDTLAAPIAGPSVSLYSAVQLARQVEAETVIPMHYDNPIFFNDPNVLKERFTDARVVILNETESVEV